VQPTLARGKGTRGDGRGHKIVLFPVSIIRMEMERGAQRRNRTYVPHKLDFDSIMRRALAVSNTNRDLPFGVSGTGPTKREAETGVN